jgi:hypothetical protein
MIKNILFMTVKDHEQNKSILDIHAEHPGTKLIDFYNMDMESLQLIAKHRLLPIPSILIFSGSKVVARLAGDIPTPTKFKSLLNLLDS